MSFDQSPGKQITSEASESTLQMPNPSCKKTYCAVMCTGYFDCKAFNAKVTKPCVCDLFLGETSGKTNTNDSMAAQRIPDY